MSNTIEGTLYYIGQTEQISDKFKKREFALEVTDTNGTQTFTNHIGLQFVQDKCGLLDNYAQGEVVKVDYNLQGREWKKDGKTRYFNSLNAWRIESVDANMGKNGYPEKGENKNDDSLPF